jgi:hypothetical protein
MFGAAAPALVEVERPRLAGKEPFSPELGIPAIARQAEAEPAVAGVGGNFRHRETGVEVLHLHSHTIGAP